VDEVEQKRRKVIRKRERLEIRNKEGRKVWRKIKN
jgi:hypothetical protein